MTTQVVTAALAFGGVAGGVSAVASGAVAWGTRLVNFIPTQSCIGAAIAGGIFGFSAGISGAVNEEGKFIRNDSVLLVITLVAIGIIMATALGPKVASLANREISHAASGVFGGFSAVVLFILLLAFSDNNG